MLMMFDHNMGRLVQNISRFNLILLLCVGLNLVLVETHDEDHHKDTTKLKGHLEPFGKSGPVKDIEEKYEFPQPYDFLVNYVQPLKPLKLSGVATNTRAVRQWTDDYLMSLDVPKDSVVELETKKKESRNQDYTAMHFHEFLKIYNDTEYYMVDDVPPYLKPDVMVPCSVQCPELLEQGLAFAMMWFSSGGTKSVIHTDSFDNINCLVRGEKSFIMMDPARDREKIKLRTEGAYSDIDVDSVDLNLYPELAEAEFYQVNITAGDCLYIPYQWIHQVRSYNSNVAINFWWNHYASTNLLDTVPGSACQGHCDPDLTLDKVNMLMDDQTLEDPQALRDWLGEIVINTPLTLHAAFDYMKKELGVEDLNSFAEGVVIEIVETLDQDGDGVVTKEEHKTTSEKTWKRLQKRTGAILGTLDDEERAERREYAQFVEMDRSAERDEL